MGTEVITLGISLVYCQGSVSWYIYLSLQEVGRDDLTPIAIEEGQGGAESGGGDTPEDSLSDDSSPARLSLVDS